MITSQQEAEFERAVHTLNRLITRIRRHTPEAFVYLDGTGNLNLMACPRGTSDPIKQEFIVTSEPLQASGGDW
jgi:hypothetical protein